MYHAVYSLVVFAETVVLVETSTLPTVRPFNAFFKPIKIETHEPSLITGYFEPELPASRVKTERFLYPIYRKPPELPNDGKWFTRADIENSNVMENRGLEIAWLDDPVDLFFLQVQESIRKGSLQASAQLSVAH